MSLRALKPYRLFPKTSHRFHPASGHPGSGTSPVRKPQKCPLPQRSLAGTTPKKKHTQQKRYTNELGGGSIIQVGR